ncbi:DEAD-box type RNA helicase [Exophiala dermatitidis]|uniref:Senataxin n=2 Tax=Exophiala dermatitidis TaxID=5970 RepID=H6BZD6_EXODN|nr:senataxin [Exophiala dermatitidis NIH/UT8656]KAJ4514417.1 DEAD-box type RNA helicase [Exophiala dermatitidis]EHY56999.1 senataxin [Exophiala dermatitidis NIH/UT8656]KAJ4519984.1 DEAD-box type RNA helicase [Exophiala dermatitidis]KAJ4523817.1 DEAD-box type RNA helicase [Exophiala dermatitidis]KAJ4537244.1 DEAD-box type RNA helicase [Exophiala dermatitidis]
MAEFISVLQEIKQLPPGQHLFCPRQNDDDQDRYEDERNPGVAGEGAVDPDRLARIEETKLRRKKFMTSLQLLAYDGRESEQYQRFIWETLDHTLGKCDICIREYYVAKVDFAASLREDYEGEDIQNFFEIINRRDIQRILQGLDGATKTLSEVPEQKRGTAVLSQKDLHALFEALVCDPFLRNEDLLQKHFDPPFKMIQAKKPLKMREILPASIKFLFDSVPVRVGWATLIWNRVDRCPTDLEWDWAMKDYIQTKLQHAYEPGDITKLWSALKLIISKLDERMITYKLFDLHPNLCTTALNHFAKRSQAVPFICQSMKMILDTAPAAFWQAMGSISSQTIVEQVFASPQFNKCLQDSASNPESKELDVLSWIPSLLDSLKPANRPAASQTIVSQLFERIDNDNLSLAARTACFNMVVTVLLTTIISFSDNEKNRRSVERLVLLDTLSLIGHRLDEILKPKKSDLAMNLSKETKEDIANIVKNSIALECQCLKSDFETLVRKEPLRHGSSSYTPEIWTAVINNLKDDEPELSAAALIGIMPLPGLEQFRIREGEPLAKDKKSFNSIFEKLTGMVARLLERISEFKPDHLDYLFRAQNTSMSLIAALFSPDNSTYQAAIEVVKNISGEFGRKEALAHLIEAFLGITIYGICWTFRRIANYRTFSSVPRMLKNGMEILDVLCNPTNGQLRAANITSRDAAAVQNYWSYQWLLLQVIFSQTERWSLEVHDKEKMIEVCRDAMQYAEALFDQYDLFASVLTKSRPPEKAQEIPKQLLDSRDTGLGSPLNTLDAMAKWLRLRDEYLADTLVSLITNMLYRLKQHQAVVTESEGLAYVQEVATTHSVKTILSASQKARLVRALEHYLDRQIERPMPKRQAKLNLKDWTETAVSRLGGSATDSRDVSTDEFGDDDIADEDLIKIENKTLTQKGLISTKDKNKIKPLLSKQQPKPARTAPVSTAEVEAKKAQQARAFIENRRREEAARKLRDKEAAARLRGKVGIGEQTSGQGSGLAGVGVIGKDHSAGTSSLMVSSESESESDSDDELFGLTSKAGPTVRDQGGLRKPVVAGPVRKIKQVRSQKDVRARLAPDLSDLHRTILSWDFFADTDLPPNSAKDDYTLVTNTFRNALDYQKTFEPLLILEGWQSFRQAREEGNFKPFEVKVANSLIVDNFVEVNSAMSFAEGKDLSIGTSDVVLLSKSSTPDQDPQQPHCLARVKEISRKKGEVQIVYRVNASNNPLRSYLNDKTTIYGVQISSLTPLEREYGALMALQYYDLCEEIIRAKPSPILDYPDSVLAPLQKTYEVNKAQAKAVKSALDNDAFTLIQGPPGSGKTKTICALVGAMMTGFIKNSDGKGVRLNAATGRPSPAPRASKKILVCAPSNAAVDELVMRLKLGVTTLDGQFEKLSVVRLGRTDAINAGVKDVTLEELVNAKLNVAAPKDPREDIHSVMMEHKAVSEELNALRDRITEQRGKGIPVPTADEQLMDALKRKKNGLGSKIDEMRERQNTASRDMELSRKRIQQEILDSAHVLCATLSGSGHEIFQSLNVEFETVIIDEAAQSIELSALIPLKYGCSKCILVGDPKQLPPTVLSREAAKFQYEQSLFARMENNHKKDVHLLDTQYRMHPAISLFPSKTFYDSRLKDGADMAKLRRRPWHQSDLFAPYRFFDVQGMSQAAPKGHSLVNIAELNVAMQLYDRLVKDVPKYDFAGKIGVITPYKGQLKELKLRFTQRYGQDITSKIEFNTTDAFQGRESEIIIFSCVRASTHGIGFLNDIRRMNVGLTRAKSSLWVLGNSQSLMQGEYWRALVNDAKARNVYTHGDILGMLRRPLLTEDMMKDDIDMMDADGPAADPVKPAPPSRRESNDPAAVPKKAGNDAAPPRSGPPSNQSTPLPSRPQSSLSRRSSTSSATKHELPPRESTQSDPRRNVNASRMEVDREQKAPPSKLRMDSNLPEPNKGVYGPSGGWNGLNDLAKCAICGSAEHFTFNCDNEDAKAAALGNCHRCYQRGHSYTSCTEPRCLSCGEVGHVTDNCKAPADMRLTEAQQKEVKRQELRFGAARDKARERRAEKQLGEHGAKIPMVKSTLPPNTPVGPAADRTRTNTNRDGTTNAGSAGMIKRKRIDESSDSDRGKVPRMNQDGRSPASAAHGNNNKNNIGLNTKSRVGTGPAYGSRPGVGGGSRDDSARSHAHPPSRPPPTGPAAAEARPGAGVGMGQGGGGLPRRPPPPIPAPGSGGPGGRPSGGGMTGPGPGQPMVRKKKANAADMFVKRK